MLDKWSAATSGGASVTISATPPQYQMGVSGVETRH